MPKFEVTAICTEEKILIVEAENEDAAIEYAKEHEDDFEPTGSDDVSFEAYEIEGKL